jgi:endonuclease/exonuclease/phosphatase (EEP) superfamily protein YafD
MRRVRLSSFLHRIAAPAILAVLAMAGLVLSGCAGPHNFTAADGPLYQGCDTPQAAAVDQHGLRVVTFNIQYSRHIVEAIDLLKAEPELAAADVLLLQEMDEDGTERIAKALGMCWVYYPATVHPKSDGNFGNAILSRVALTNPRKVIMPHLGALGRTQRIATSASIELSGRTIRLYSLHVATWAELTREQRRDQVEAVIADAHATEGDVIIGGDLNDSDLVSSFEAAGFTWLTRDIGATCKLWSIDHVFTRGLVATGTRGKIGDNRGSSDHCPVWVSVAGPEAMSPRTPVASRTRS